MEVLEQHMAATRCGIRFPFTAVGPRRSSSLIRIGREGSGRSDKRVSRESFADTPLKPSFNLGSQRREKQCQMPMRQLQTIVGNIAVTPLENQYIEGLD